MVGKYKINSGNGYSHYELLGYIKWSIDDMKAFFKKIGKIGDTLLNHSSTITSI